MPRSYRSIILALVGWLTLAAAPTPNSGAQADHAAPRENAQSAPGNVSSARPQVADRTGSAEYQAPCADGEYNNKSDLCAQWYAARAAGDAADWAYWAVFWAALGSALSAFGIFGLYWQVYLTRQAVADTGEATKAMRNANEIADETMRRQLRAYLTVEPGGVNAVVDGQARLPVKVENKGQTPAFGVMIFANHGVAENPRDITLDDLGTPLAGEINDAAMGPGVCRWMYSYASEALLKPYAEDIAAKRRAVIQFGYVTYKDAFGATWQTNFAFYHWGEVLSDETALRCRFGNHAT